jgi:hypothetical protein
MGAAGHPGEHADNACSEPADAVVEFGCLHEHVFRERKCALHGQMIAAGNMGAVCSACWEGRGGIPRHECKLLGRVVAEGVTRR